jgi:hypothetical protein
MFYREAETLLGCTFPSLCAGTGMLLAASRIWHVAERVLVCR